MYRKEVEALVVYFVVGGHFNDECDGIKTLVEHKQKPINQGHCFFVLRLDTPLQIACHLRDMVVVTVVKDNTIIKLYVHKRLVMVKCRERVLFLIMMLAV